MPWTTEPTAEDLAGIAYRIVGYRASLDIDDVRALYLFGPASLPGTFADGPGIMMFRTSLDAVLGDVRPLVGRDDHGRRTDAAGSRLWLAAAGYLMLIDQLGTVLEGSFEKLLRSDLARLSEEHAAALYALRNAFLHSYGLVNDPDATRMREERRKLLRHTFKLDVDSGVLVYIDDRTDVLTKPLSALPATHVDLALLGDLVEGIVAEIRRRFLARTALAWQTEDVDTFIACAIFTHGA